MKSRKKPTNEMKISFLSYSVNESLSRSLAAAFVSQLNPTVEELSDIKCAVSEAVTNCIVHAYRDTCGTVYIDFKIYADRTFRCDIRDSGCGIGDVEQAMRPLFTTDPASERCGMGFAVMENFMDTLKVTSKVGRGTKVTMTKKLSALPIQR